MYQIPSISFKWDFHPFSSYTFSRNIPSLPLTLYAPFILPSYLSHLATGQLCTLSTPHGPQVGDLNIFSLNNHRERFWAARTRQLHASHVSVGDRLWSNLPFLRPLCTIVGDSLRNYGVDEVGGRCHDLLGTRWVEFDSGWGKGKGKRERRNKKRRRCWLESGLGVILMVSVEIQDWVEDEIDSVWLNESESKQTPQWRWFRLPMPLQSRPRSPALRPNWVRRPWRPECISSYWTQ
jgi:hypothetical protein